MLSLDHLPVPSSGLPAFLNKYHLSTSLGVTTPGDYALSKLTGRLPSPEGGAVHSVFAIHPDYGHYDAVRSGMTADILSLVKFGSRGRFGVAPTMAVIDTLRENFGFPMVNLHTVRTDGKVHYQLYAASLYPPFAYGNPVFAQSIKDEIRTLLKRAADFGATYGGFGALTGTHDRSFDLRSENLVALNDGNPLTAIGIWDSIQRAMHLRNIELSSSRIAVLGATGAVGIAFLRHTLGQIPKLNLAVKSSALKQSWLASELRRAGSEVVEFDGPQAALTAVKDADVVVIVTADPNLNLSAKAFEKPKVIICDAARPRASHPDLPHTLPHAFVYDGPTVWMADGEVAFPEQFGLEAREILCCMAQTSLLAIAGYSDHFAIYPRKMAQEEFRSFFREELAADLETVQRLFKVVGFQFTPWFRWHERIFSPREHLSRATIKMAVA